MPRRTDFSARACSNSDFSSDRFGISRESELLRFDGAAPGSDAYRPQRLRRFKAKFLGTRILRRFEWRDFVNGLKDFSPYEKGQVTRAMRRQIHESTWAEVRTAYASGIGLRELARNLGIPAGTVLARSKREGWTRQIQSAKALAISPAQSPSRSTAEAVAMTMAERGKRHVERVAGVVERTMPAVEGMEPGMILDRIEDIDRLDKVARRAYGLADGAGVSIGVVNIALLGMTPEEVGAPVVFI